MKHNSFLPATAVSRASDSYTSSQALTPRVSLNEQWAKRSQQQKPIYYNRYQTSLPLAPGKDSSPIFEAVLSVLIFKRVIWNTRKSGRYLQTCNMCVSTATTWVRCYNKLYFKTLKLKPRATCLSSHLEKPAVKPCFRS